MSKDVFQNSDINSSMSCFIAFCAAVTSFFVMSLFCRYASTAPSALYGGGNFVLVITNLTQRGSGQRCHLSRAASLRYHRQTRQG